MFIVIIYFAMEMQVRIEFSDMNQISFIIPDMNQISFITSDKCDKWIIFVQFKAKLWNVRDLIELKRPLHGQIFDQTVWLKHFEHVEGV